MFIVSDDRGILPPVLSRQQVIAAITELLRLQADDRDPHGQATARRILRVLAPQVSAAGLDVTRFPDVSEAVQ